ncbi:glycosyltransferase family 61 protein [Pseudoruegeria sp. SHC-113]|uniref:glycosyltransferase family 61 protein n=1 Tax=Pseudoruegeria sp. SHC-113 TaxID=2855439 RepID=UPI0021BAB3DA|nr:glycosyltransferase family 61 protein [Pseudoruegeria sp. SHC-113]MCT8159465.1 glycosyltransferase family 61 protein [Pseudoruegeria sp. SHC-113]
MAEAFDPQALLLPGVEVIENAVVVPWGPERKRGIARPAGVFYPDGTLCDAATCLRSFGRPTTLPTGFPDASEIAETIPGTHLFAGLAYGHFGHALCESLGRLWYLDQPNVQIAGLYFFPKAKKSRPRNALSGVLPLLKALKVRKPPMASNTPLRFERLVVPPQGFGVHEMIAGAPEFRAFVRNRLKAGTATGAGRKIYISRSRLYSKRGRILQEQLIEERLVAEGYEIFHPQAHDITEQLATYRAADSIISTDNSALHLAAFVMPKGARVALLIRRPGDIYKDFVLQLSRFAETEPVIVDCGTNYWALEAERVSFNEVYTGVDFPAMGRALAEAGFIKNGAWPEADARVVEDQIAGYAQGLGGPVVEVFPPARLLKGGSA